MALCRNCGEYVQEGKKFCSSCGQPVPADAGGQQQTYSQPQSGPYAQQQQPPQSGPYAQQQQQQQSNYQQSIQQGMERLGDYARNTADETDYMDPADIAKNKTMAGLAYFLFFLPLIACPDSKYARFHANQSLLLLILGAVVGVANTLIGIILGLIRLWAIAGIVSAVTGLAVTVLYIMGLVNGFTGKAKELPLIGGFKLLK